jgi:hypothetical protein
MPTFAAFGLTLFEIGRFSLKGFLRWQGFLLVALGFLQYLKVDLWDTELFSPLQMSPNGDLKEFVTFSIVNSRLFSLLVLVAAGYWLLERTRNRERCTAIEYTVGLAADALGTISIALWFAYRFPSTWVPVPGGAVWVTAIWATMATLLLALAWLLRRRAFLIQAVALAIAVVLRGWFLDLFVDNATGFWHGPLFHLSVAALVLLGALPFAFKLRGRDFWASKDIQLAGGMVTLLQRPEQWFFFAPFALVVVALAVKLTFGHITIGWSLLGVGVFLFALAVGERSYRLTGLGLLLVSVAKIVLIDIWSLAPSERYTTLIVLGAALLTVSFLYTRFSAVIRRYL